MTREAPTSLAVLITPSPIAPTPKTATVEPSATYVNPESDSSMMNGRTDTGLLDYGTPCCCDTATEQADLLQRCSLVHSNYGHVRYDRVLRESRSAHLKMY